MELNGPLRLESGRDQTAIGLEDGNSSRSVIIGTWKIAMSPCKESNLSKMEGKACGRDRIAPGAGRNGQACVLWQKL